jgi:hypothetical protein
VLLGCVSGWGLLPWGVFWRGGGGGGGGHMLKGLGGPPVATSVATYSMVVAKAGHVLQQEGDTHGKGFFVLIQTAGTGETIKGLSNIVRSVGAHVRGGVCAGVCGEAG